MMYVTEFGDKKLIEYLKDGQYNLVECMCGLGDVIMILPYFKQICDMYPNIKFDFRTKNQDCFFSNYSKDYSVYDYVFKLVAYFNEKDPEYQHCTKPECNSIRQIGIPYDKNLEYTYKLPCKKIEGYDNVVGCAFCNSCFPHYINCNYNVARNIWEMLKENGFKPLELFHPTYRRAWENCLNQKYDFIDNTIRKDDSGLPHALDVMCSMKGMASVATGNFHFGMTVYPEKILYLKKDFKYQYFTNKEILSLDTLNPDYGIVKEWIQRLKQ